MKKYYTVIFVLLLLNIPVKNFAQTNELGNYQFYTRETGSSAFGYMTLKFDMLPDYPLTISNSGVSYNHYYDLYKIGTLPVEGEHQIGFYLQGAFKIGIAAGDNGDSLKFFFGKELTYYAFMVDFYNLSIVPEYTFVLDNGYAFTTKLGFNLLNVGLSTAFPKGGVAKEHLIGTINLIPLAFAPSLYVDFGRSGLGVSFYINPLNILAYNFIPKGSFKDALGNEHFYFDQNKNGLKAFDSSMKRYDFQITFTF